MKHNTFSEQQKSNLLHFKGESADYLVILGILYIPNNKSNRDIYFKVLLKNGISAYIDPDFNIYMESDFNHVYSRTILSSNINSIKKEVNTIRNSNDILINTSFKIIFEECYFYELLNRYLLPEHLPKIGYFPKLNIQIPICIKTGRVPALNRISESITISIANILKSKNISLYKFEELYVNAILNNFETYIAGEINNIIFTERVDYLPNIYSTILTSLHNISQQELSEKQLIDTLNTKLSTFLPKFKDNYKKEIEKGNSLRSYLETYMRNPSQFRFERGQYYGDNTIYFRTEGGGPFPTGPNTVVENDIQPPDTFFAANT